MHQYAPNSTQWIDPLGLVKYCGNAIEYQDTSTGPISQQTPSEARQALENAGYPGKSVTNPSGTETGTIHNIPDRKMDVRIMDGGPVHSPRVVTSREGTSQPVHPETGKNFGNIPKADQRAQSHILLQ